MQRTRKQDEFFTAYKSGKYSIFLLGGGTGSAKTIGILMLIHAICTAIPGVRIGVFRKSEKNLKVNTIPSFKKVLAMQNTSVPIVDMVAKYPNGSEILFLWADITKDPDCNNVKGGEFTLLFFNEVNQIDQQYLEIGKTRVGRWNSFVLGGKPYQVKPCIFMDCNPTNNWVKSEFYDKHIAGTLPANVFFQLSLPSDNPYNSKEYLELLETLPFAEYERYVKGNWEYGDDPNQLIKFEWLRDNFTDPSPEANKLGVDVAREGDDNSVFSFVKDNRQTGLEIVRQTQNVIILAEIAIQRMLEKNIGADETRIDVVGVGGGTVDAMKLRGYNIQAYNSGAAPDTQNKTFLVNGVSQTVDSFLQFYNRRAQDYWNLRERLITGEIKLLNDPDLIRELTNIRYIVKDKVIQIEAKKEIKKRLGYSPDRADATCISFSNFKSNHFSFAFG